MSPKNLTDTL